MKKQLLVLRDKKPNQTKQKQVEVSKKPCSDETCPAASLKGSDILHMEGDLPPSVGLESRTASCYLLLLALAAICIII